MSFPWVHKASEALEIAQSSPAAEAWGCMAVCLEGPGQCNFPSCPLSVCTGTISAMAEPCSSANTKQSKYKCAIIMSANRKEKHYLYCVCIKPSAKQQSSKGLSAKASALLATKITFKASPHTLKPLGNFVFLYLE